MLEAHHLADLVQQLELGIRNEPLTRSGRLCISNIEPHVRIADSSEAVAVVNHVVAGSARIRALRESMPEACGYLARGLK